MIKRIIDDYTHLEISPYMGPSLSAKVPFDTDFRFLISGNYLVFYKVEDDFVSIYRILYGKRDYVKIIFDNIEFDIDEEYNN